MPRERLEDSDDLSANHQHDCPLLPHDRGRVFTWRASEPKLKLRVLHSTSPRCVRCETVPGGDAYDVLSVPVSAILRRLDVLNPPQSTREKL